MRRVHTLRLLMIAAVAAALAAPPAPAAPAPAAPAAPAPAAAAPAPTTGSVHAFLLVTAPGSFADFRAHYQRIGAVYPTFFRCDRTTGQIVGRDIPAITRFAQARKVRVLTRIDCQHAATLHRILTEPALRQTTLVRALAIVARYGYDGLNLDFEAAPPSDRGAYTSFVTDLASRLHAAGRKLSIDVSSKQRDDPNHPRSGLYDYPALAQAADYVFVMAWGLHWQTSAPGPIAGWPWFTKIVDYVTSLPSHERYVIGAPLYGFDWPDGGGPSHPGTAFEYADIVALATRVGATPQFDAAAHEGHFGYTDAASVPHDVWFMPAQAVLDRFGYARDRGFGTGLWRLGREDQSLWTRLP